jgi:hypothetical protein
MGGGEVGAQFQILPGQAEFTLIIGRGGGGVASQKAGSLDES